jgi:hypothetical protein
MTRTGLAPVCVALLAALITASCAAATSQPSQSASPSTKLSEPIETATPTAQMPASPTATTTGQTSQPPASTDVPATLRPSPTAELATWQTAVLRDVRSGEVLRIADLAGRLVVIEPMAIWCTNCRAQQDAAVDALVALGDGAVVYVSLDVDPNEIAPDLAAYADARGYGWHFAVASREVARSLAATFGDQVLSPPSTPKIIVAPTGEASVSYGFKSAADLQAQLVAYLP